MLGAKNGNKQVFRILIVMPKKKRTRIFTTKLQVFAAIAWVLMCGMLTINFTDTYNYILGLLIVTGACLLAWGVPFAPGIVYRLFMGQQLGAFKINEGKKRKK